MHLTKLASMAEERSLIYLRYAWNPFRFRGFFKLLIELVKVLRYPFFSSFVGAD
jgi:hypothetical protein